MKILISDKIHEKGIKLLEDNNFKVTKKFSISQEKLREEITDFDGIIVRSGTKLYTEELKRAENLKVIGRAGVGLDNIDLDEAEKLGIKVFNTAEAPSVSVAELTIGLIISLMRHIPRADKTMHCGDWLKSDYLGTVLYGKKIGLIGFGNIGSEVAKRANAFGMKVGIYDVDKKAKQRAKDLGYIVYPSVDKLIQESQIISLHIPSTVKTENTIDERRLNMMGEDNMVINTARGNLIDEVALLKALRSRKIKGAALDVFRKEPLENMEICNFEGNLILTPHIGSQTVETQINAGVGVAQKVSDYLKNL
jgi:D-3-phosphoglycerate dehydrogenase